MDEAENTDIAKNLNKHFNIGNSGDLSSVLMNLSAHFTNEFRVGIEDSIKLEKGINLERLINSVKNSSAFMTMKRCGFSNVESYFAKGSFDENNNLGYFAEMNPSYTIFHKDNNTFSNIWTEYNQNFIEFYKNYEKDMSKYRDKKDFITKKCVDSNLVNISAIPWTSFTGFNLNLPKGDKYLLPIFTTGKYFEENNKILLPLSLQVHHSVCDGFHTSRFINELQELLNTFENKI